MKNILVLLVLSFISCENKGAFIHAPIEKYKKNILSTWRVAYTTGANAATDAHDKGIYSPEYMIQKGFKDSVEFAKIVNSIYK